jgi:hypothetical protein
MRPLRSTIIRTRSTLVVRSLLSGKRAIVEQMADDLRMLSASADQVTADDLELTGWTLAQINIHHRDAARLAREWSVLEAA